MDYVVGYAIAALIVGFLLGLAWSSRHMVSVLEDLRHIENERDYYRSLIQPRLANGRFAKRR
jgi:hypothetical protein